MIALKFAFWFGNQLLCHSRILGISLKDLCRADRRSRCCTRFHSESRCRSRLSTAGKSPLNGFVTGAFSAVVSAVSIVCLRLSRGSIGTALTLKDEDRCTEWDENPLTSTIHDLPNCFCISRLTFSVYGTCSCAKKIALLPRFVFTPCDDPTGC